MEILKGALVFENTIYEDVNADFNPDDEFGEHGVIITESGSIYEYQWR